jgi:hypothetical protein
MKNEADLFPNMPSAVFDAWIRPFIEDRGWSFRSLDDSLSNTRWSAFFCDLPLRYWARLSWELRDVPIDKNFSILDSFTLTCIQRVIDHATDPLGCSVRISNDTPQRFFGAASYIKTNGHLPGPPLVGDMIPKLRIVEGHHRLAALSFVGVPPNFATKVWIGSAEKPG